MNSGSIFISHAGADDEAITLIERCSSLRVHTQMYPYTLIGTLIFVEGTYADVPLHTDFIDHDDRSNAPPFVEIGA